MKLLTVEDYQKAGESFWPKYWYVAKELGEDAKAEDILRVMEAIGGVALKFALEEKEGPFGFNKRERFRPLILQLVYLNIQKYLIPVNVRSIVKLV